jgi:uncharacterized membrane protein
MMAQHPRKWDDRLVELVIGNMLRAGVLTAAVLVFAGGVFFLIHNSSVIPHYKIFNGEPSDLRSISGIFTDALALKTQGAIQLGLLVLIATPVARVAFSVLAFLVERDFLYTAVTLVVLSVLMFSLLAGGI